MSGGTPATWSRLCAAEETMGSFASKSGVWPSIVQINVESWGIVGEVSCYCNCLSQFDCDIGFLFSEFHVVVSVYQSLVCQALYTQVLRLLVKEINEYNMVFVDPSDGKYCLVRTWDGNSLREVCVDVQPLGQRVPVFELTSLSCVPEGRWPLSLEGGIPSLIRVLSDSRDDGRIIILCRDFYEAFILMFQAGPSRSVGHTRSDNDD